MLLQPPRPPVAIFRDEFGGDRKSDQVRNLQSCSFVEATADATGKHASTISRAAARGEAIGVDLHTIVGTSLDKGVELDALAKMTPALFGLMFELCAIRNSELTKI